jgi:hypothetical protein
MLSRLYGLFLNTMFVLFQELTFNFIILRRRLQSVCWTDLPDTLYPRGLGDPKGTSTPGPTLCLVPMPYHPS